MQGGLGEKWYQVSEGTGALCEGFSTRRFYQDACLCAAVVCRLLSSACILYQNKEGGARGYIVILSLYLSLSLSLFPPKEPHERARLYFLLAWLHAILQERLRYSPLGWAKKYEFNESDLKMACDTLDTWLESVAQVTAFLW